MRWKEVFKKDLYRHFGGDSPPLKYRLLLPPEIKYMKLFRIASNPSSIIFLDLIRRYRLRRISLKTHIQIPKGCQIGEGFYIGHFGRIIINVGSKIGRNCNIATGCVIGAENRGERKGAPQIGNGVWIGANSVIVGNIKIGDDVMIAPMTFVNCDIPSHSIVIGNPAHIISNPNATNGYINNRV